MLNAPFLLAIDLFACALAFLCLALERQTAKRLRALRSTCYLTDHDGVRRRYHRVSVHKQREAER